jgi:hypothetical protein
VTAIQSMQPIFPGSSPNVTCVAEFDDTVDVPLDATIILYRNNEHQIDSDYSVHRESNARYTKTFTINNIRESQEYTCVFVLIYSEPSVLYILLPQNSSMTSTTFHAFLNVSISKL